MENYQLSSPDLLEFDNVKKCIPNKYSKNNEGNQQKHIINAAGIIEVDNVEVQLQIHEQLPQIIHANPSSSLHDFEKSTQMKIELNDLRPHDVDLKVSVII